MPAPPDRARWTVPLCLIALVLAVTTLRIWLAGRLGLAPDEAYYWTWSLDPGLSYRDHPPMVAWLIALGTTWVGQTAIGVRLLTILIAGGASVIIYHLGRTVELSPGQALVAVALAITLPVPAVGALIATPDTPLGLLWLLGLLALARLVRSPQPSAWLLLGLSCGLAGWAKHSALLLLPVVAICLIRVRRLRAEMRRVAPWLSALLAIAIAVPFFIIDFRSGGSSTAFQWAHLSGEQLVPPSEGGVLGALQRIGELVAGQFGLLTPLVALWVVLFFARSRYHPQAVVLLTGFAVPLIATGISALATHPEQNWAALGHPMAGIIAVAAIARTEQLPRMLRRPRLWLALTCGSAALLTAVIHIHALHPILPLPAERDPVARLWGWDGLAHLEPQLGDATAVVADHYGLAAQLRWQSRWFDHPQVYSSDRPPAPPRGRWLLVDDQGDWLDRDLRVICATIVRRPPLLLTNPRGEVVRTLHLSIGEQCRLPTTAK